MPDTPEELLRDLEKDIELVCKEVTNLLASRAMYRSLLEMVDKNPEIQKPSFFYSWLRSQYAATQSIGVRRMIDGDPRSLSLNNLLNSLWKVSHLITADRHAGFYQASALGPETGYAEFRQFATSDGVSFNLAMVAGDLQTLRSTAQAIKAFADKRVAHTQKIVAKSKLPTFGQLDAALDLLESLAVKYRLLLICLGGDLTPVILDYEGIFQVAWAPPERF